MDHWQLVRRLASGVLRRRKLLAGLTLVLALGALIPTAYYSSKEPPRFQTSATILLEVRPDRLPVFQEFSPFRPLAVQLAILRSRSLAQGVIESLPKNSLQDLIENPYYVDYAQIARNTFRRLTGSEPEVDSPHARALKELQEARVRFEPAQEGIVVIRAEATQPQVAVDLATTYIELLLSRTRTFNIDDTRVSREFLEQQLTEIKKELTTSEDALRAFTSANGGVKIPERAQATVTQLGQAETALAEIESSRKMLTTRLAALREKLEKQKSAPAPATTAAATPAPVSSMPSGEVKRLRDQLAQLEKAIIDLRTKYTEEHPRVTLVKERIADIQRDLANAVKETTNVTPAPGAVPPAERVNFAQQVLALETSLHALTAQEEGTRSQVNSLRQSLSGLSRSEMAYSRLSREADNNRSLHALLSDKLAAVRIREQGEMKVVKVIDPPGASVSATNQKRLRFLAMACLLALALGGGVPLAAELLNRRVEGEEDVASAAGLPVLTIVPRMPAPRPVFRSANDMLPSANLDDHFVFSEAFRTLRVGLQLASRSDNVRSVLVTSAYPGEGKSTVVMNLGRAFTEGGVKVVVADTDFLRPTLHHTMKIPATGGLEEALEARRPITETLVQLQDGMWVAAPVKPMGASAKGSLATRRLKTVVEDMSTMGEFVLCDSAPVLIAPDSLFLATAVDAVVIVVKAGETTCRDLARTKATLEGVGARILGVVINQMPPLSLRRHYRRYYGGYYRAGASS